MFALLGLFVLVAVSACTTNNNEAQTDVNGQPQDEIIDAGDIVQVDTPLTKNNWLWQSTTKADGKVEPKQKDAFVMMFQEEMMVNGTTDCNNYFGDYSANVEGDVSFGPLASTMMYCEDAQEGVFLGDLNQVDSYTIEEDGSLSLNLKDNAGVMKFEVTELNGQEEEV